ncbi:MAG: GGDEF domain-containing protein [Woeseia sp.]
MFLLKPLTERFAALTAAIAAALTFAFDLSQPLGVAGGMPYVVLPLLGLLARSSRIVLAAALLGSALTVAGVMNSVAGSQLSTVVINRTMIIVLIWVATYLALRHLSIGRELRKLLREQALTDPLTGLFNRRHVFACIDKELKHYDRYKTVFSIILIDADHFKQVNDNYGHCTGDATLRLIARVCRDAVRGTDVVGRFGGEEFIILLPHTTTTEAAVVAERIRRDMGTVSNELLDGAVLVTLSLGVAEVGPGRNDFNSLLAAADKALYEAKNAGRNRVSVRPGAAASAPSSAAA